MKKRILFFLLAYFAGSSLLQAQYSLSENFSGAVFPPAGWTRGPGTDDSGNPVWSRTTLRSGFPSTAGSAIVDFYNWSTGTDSLISPVFTATSASDSLYFDNAYCTFDTQVDDLKVFVSSDGGSTWTLLQDLPGGPNVGTGMVTAAPFTGTFTPANSDWVSRIYPLSSGVNRIKFEVTSSFGNNLYLDNIKVGAPLPLPVTISSIGAYQQNSGVLVYWNTQNELNLKSYAIEKSQDGIAFTAIGSVSPKTGTVNNYSLFDAAPFAGVNFYRIKSMDIDGKINYSVIVRVNINDKKQAISVYPNPVKGNSFNLYLNNIIKGSYTLKLCDMNGKTVLNKIINHTGGSSVQNVELQSSVGTGMYELKLTGTDQINFNQIVLIGH